MNRRWHPDVPFDSTGLLCSMAAAVVFLSFASRCTAEPHDCGFQSLYTLLRMEGVTPTIAELENKLPEPSPRGYSLLELREAAMACGLDLTGVRLPDDLGSLDRPALVHLRRGEAGHFIIVRPIDRGGGRIQVIDPNGPPYVLPAADLHDSNEWTGLALIPRRPIRLALVVGALAVIAALIAGSFRIIPQIVAIRRLRGSAPASS